MFEYVQLFLVSYLAGPEDVAEKVVGAKHEEGEDRRLHEKQGLVDSTQQRRLQQHPNLLRSNPIEQLRKPSQRKSKSRKGICETHAPNAEPLSL